MLTKGEGIRIVARGKLESRVRLAGGGRVVVDGFGRDSSPRNASRVHNFNEHQSEAASPPAASHEAIRILAAGTVMMGRVRH